MPASASQLRGCVRVGVAGVRVSRQQLPLPRGWLALRLDGASCPQVQESEGVAVHLGVQGPWDWGRECSTYVT